MIIWQFFFLQPDKPKTRANALIDLNTKRKGFDVGITIKVNQIHATPIEQFEKKKKRTRAHTPNSIVHIWHLLQYSGHPQDYKKYTHTGARATTLQWTYAINAMILVWLRLVLV